MPIAREEDLFCYQAQGACSNHAMDRKTMTFLTMDRKTTYLQNIGLLFKVPIQEGAFDIHLKRRPPIMTCWLIVYGCVCVNISMYALVCMYVYICMCFNVCTSVCIIMYDCVCVKVSVYMCMYVCMCVHFCVDVSVCYVYVQM